MCPPVVKESPAAGVTKGFGDPGVEGGGLSSSVRCLHAKTQHTIVQNTKPPPSTVAAIDVAAGGSYEVSALDYFMHQLGFNEVSGWM